MPKPPAFWGRYFSGRLILDVTLNPRSVPFLSLGTTPLSSSCSPPMGPHCSRESLIDKGVRQKVRKLQTLV